MNIARSLENVTESPEAVALMDKSSRIVRLTDNILRRWIPDPYTRRPAPAVVRDNKGYKLDQGTDYDFFSWIMGLSSRRAVITLPSYSTLRPRSLEPNRRVLSSINRHGQIIRLQSNKRTHAFSVLIKDLKVEKIVDGRNVVGIPTSFALADDSGELYDGWKTVEWRANPEEERFLRRNRLEAYRDTVEFEYFVHPALANSFLSSQYLLAKIAEMRIADQAHYWYSIAKQLGMVISHKQTPKQNGPKVLNLEARLELPELSGEYSIKGIREDGSFTDYHEIPKTEEGRQEVLRYVVWVRKKLLGLGRKLRVPTRAVELAFFLYGFKSSDREPGSEIKPGWAVPEWQEGYVLPGKRIEWNALELNPHVRLLYRIRETTARVRAPAYSQVG